MKKMTNRSRNIHSLRIKKKVLVMKNSITEMKNIFFGFISKLNVANEKLLKLKLGEKQFSKLICKEIMNDNN